MGVSQVWGDNTYGGYSALPELSKKVRHAAQKQMIWRQFCEPIDGFGANKGDQIKFDRVAHLDTSTVGVAVPETSKLPEKRIALTQGYVMVDEYGDKVPYTRKLVKLQDIKVDDAAVKELRYLMTMTHNKLASDQFKATKVKYAPTNTAADPQGVWDTDGTQTTDATRDMQVWDIEEIEEYMKDTLNIPPREDGSYVCVHSPGFLTAIRRDSKWRDTVKYVDPKDAYQGEIGKFLHTRFVESNYGLSSRMNTSYRGEAVFFGADAVAYAVADPEHIWYGEDPTEGGRAKWVGWDGIFGYKIMWDTATAGECRIIHVCGTA
jgi:N4-gp56 family major capsid protein